MREYFISVPPLTADKTQLRSDQAWRIRALGPAFHALAEINVTGWTSWVATTGSSWYAAGVEARRRMAAAGYDVATGDTWALNELSSAVRQGVGNARANMRAFLNGLYDGDGVLPAARGVVFVAGIGQATSDLSVYQARLQEWYEDAAFWSDLSRYASDWSQELYGDVRTYAVAGMTPRGAARLAERVPAASGRSRDRRARSGRRSAGVPCRRGQPARERGVAVRRLVRLDRRPGGSDAGLRLGADLRDAFGGQQPLRVRVVATEPRRVYRQGEFNAQTDALLVRLAASIADSSETPEPACGSTWCTGALDGAAATTAWRTFATWKPSILAFTTAEQTLPPGTPSAPVTVELRTSSGSAYTAGLPVTVELSSSSPTGELSTGSGGPWTTTLTTSIASGQSTTSFHFRDSSSGTSDDHGGGNRQDRGHADGDMRPRRHRPHLRHRHHPYPATSATAAASPSALLRRRLWARPADAGERDAVRTNRRRHGDLCDQRQEPRGPCLTCAPHRPTPVASRLHREPGRPWPGCTGTTTITCDLDFLVGELVATVRVLAVVREPGTLTLTAASPAQPGDVQPANDTARLVTVVNPAAPLLPPANVATLRALGTTPASVTRRGRPLPCRSASGSARLRGSRHA